MADDKRERGPAEQAWHDALHRGDHFSADGDFIWKLENATIAERVAAMVKERKQPEKGE